MVDTTLRTMLGGVFYHLPDVVSHFAEEASYLWVESVHQHGVDRWTDVPQHEVSYLTVVHSAPQPHLFVTL